MNKDIMEDPQKKKQEEEKIPMRRIGEPEEIAKVVLVPFGMVIHLTIMSNNC